jgi:Dyp-type peroxidase family
MTQPKLDLDDIQGDVLQRLRKNAETFLFFKIVEKAAFNRAIHRHVVGSITSARQVRQCDLEIGRRKHLGGGRAVSFRGVNLGFTKDGLDQLSDGGRPLLESAFERGAGHGDTIGLLNDPPPSVWLDGFVADRIDGVFLIAGPHSSFVTYHANELLRLLGGTIKVVYAEMGNVRPGRERGHEHFGFLDGVSQPGIRGLTRPSKPIYRPDEGLPGQDLLWPGEFVFGYPGQDPNDPVKPGKAPDMAAPWMKNGSFMVFRRLEQKVPEFRKFVAERAARLGMDRELLAARMFGRWKSGAPLERAPLRDDPALGADPNRNNDFAYADDPFQRKCPYAAHIRKAYPRDDAGNEAEVLRHRIIRAGIPFGPEVEPGETTTRHSRGLMFVCYQTSIERQFEYIQRRYADNPDFATGKMRPGGGAVTPGYDPVIGQAPGDEARYMDEPYPNYPAGTRRTTLDIPSEFVVLTAAAYFFMPSITALRTVLTRSF